jgi:hypothetical protein
VGYGANPNQLLDKVRELRPRFMVRGNHDKVCAGLEPDGAFSLPAHQAADWTREKLRQDNWRFLADLPVGPLWVGEDYQIAHGSPMDEDAYLLHMREISLAFDAFEGQLCFFGHTHLPGMLRAERSPGAAELDLPPAGRVVRPAAPVPVPVPTPAPWASPGTGIRASRS